MLLVSGDKFLEIETAYLVFIGFQNSSPRLSYAGYFHIDFAQHLPKDMAIHEFQDLPEQLEEGDTKQLKRDCFYAIVFEMGEQNIKNDFGFDLG